MVINYDKPNLQYFGSPPTNMVIESWSWYTGTYNQQSDVLGVSENGDMYTHQIVISIGKMMINQRSHGALFSDKPIWKSEIFRNPSA